MDGIPTYALYGELDSQAEVGWLHWETLLSRSRLHDFRIAPHRHEEFFQILLLTGGHAAASVDDLVRDLAPPALVIVPPASVHSYEFSPDVEGYVVTLFARDIREALAGHERMAQALFAPAMIEATETGPDLAGAADALRALIAESDGHGGGMELAIRARLALLLVAIDRALAAPAIARANGDPVERHARAFSNLVDREYRNRRDIAFYADALAITPAHLNRVSRRTFGRSALSVIERRVVLEAKRYLMFSSLSVKEIAILLGYPDPAYFSRFFSRQAGLPPSGFRDKAQSRHVVRADKGKT
ncbi:MAG TPA: helix-turn-helix domain-containing protein [Devosiaceae bacterium]